MSADSRGAWGTSLAVFVLSALLLGAVILPAPGVVTIDGYYHLKVAGLIARDPPWQDIRWLPLTVLGEEGPDHHWLWHVLLVPFTWIPDPFMGLKVASVLTAATVPAIATWLLFRLGVPWPWLFGLLVLGGATVMPGRLAMLRAQTLAIPALLLALGCLATHRYRMLAVLSLGMMQAYHGAVLLLPLALGQMALRRLEQRCWAWQGPVAVGAGLSAGLVLSPWFPQNVDYLLFHTLYKLTNPQQLTVGSEWLRPQALHMVQECWPLLLFLGAAALGWSRSPRRDGALRGGRDLWLFGGATVLCLFLYGGAWRFVEYFVPMGAMLAGLLTRDAIRRPPSRWLPAVGALVLVAALAQGLGTIQHRAEFEPGKYREIASEIHKRSGPHDRVFNRAWEDFVFLFWQDGADTYVAGLDPNYLAYADPGRFRVWRWIQSVQADEENDPAPLIADLFGARWAVIDHHGAQLAARLQESPHATLIKHTRWGWLYEINLPEAGNGKHRD